MLCVVKLHMSDALKTPVQSASPGPSCHVSAGEPMDLSTLLSTASWSQCRRGVCSLIPKHTVRQKCSQPAEDGPSSPSELHRTWWKSPPSAAQDTTNFQPKKGRKKRSIQPTEMKVSALLFRDPAPVSLSKVERGSGGALNRSNGDSLPPTRARARPRRHNIRFSMLFKTYQQFLSLTPNQAEGTRSTSYGRLFPTPPGLPLLSCPATGPKP